MLVGPFEVIIKVFSEFDKDLKAYIGYSKIIGYSRIIIIIIMQEAKILTKNIQSSSPASSIAGRRFSVVEQFTR